MEENAENLVSQNPRDSLILRRRSNLNRLKEKALSIKREGVENFYHSYLRIFARNYLAEQNPDVFESLNEKEKEALSKICASSCKFKLIRHSSILTAVLGSLVTLGLTNANPIGTTMLSFILFVFYCLCDGPKYLIDYIRYLRSHKIMSKNNKRE